MARRGSGLADRLRKAVEREESARSSDEKERLQRLEQERAARSSLFDDLAAFGEELGFTTVDLAEDRVTIHKGERWLRFSASGPGHEVEVDFTGRDEEATHRLYREAALDHRWIWVRNRQSREDRLPLFDQGLEVLLVHALDLPSPTVDPSDQPTVAPPPAGAADPGVDDEPKTGPKEVKRTL